MMYRATLCPAGDLVALAHDLWQGHSQCPFTSPYWLGSLADVFGSDENAFAGLAVRAAGSGEVAAVLPLVVSRPAVIATAASVDFGVTDYCSPLLGAAFPSSENDRVQFRRCVLEALKGFDVLRLRRLLPVVEGRRNPITLASAAQRTRVQGHVVRIAHDVPGHLSALGSKVRREIDRCRRHIAEAGPLKLARAVSLDGALTDFACLERTQSQRWRGEADRYRLDRPDYARFYRTVLERGFGEGFADVLTLRAGDEFVGAVFVIRNARRAVFLRIATNDGRWARSSPGRLTFIAAFEHYCGMGLREFDLGIGDYEYKRRLGAEPERLSELTAALSWRGVPVAAALRTKALLGRQPALKRMADRIRGRG